MTTLEKVIESIVSVMSCEIGEVSEESTGKDLGIDSIDAIEILINAELEFMISIQDEEAADCKNVGDFVKLIDSKIEILK